MEIEDVLRKLIGPIEPTGESNADRDRLDNLRILTEVVDRLLFDIAALERFKGRSEAGMKRIGAHASYFMQSVKDS